MMKKVYEIQGRPTIDGTISVQGCKNSALAIIIASLLVQDVVILENVPNIKDINELIIILKKLNVKVSFIDNTMIIDSKKMTYESLLIEQVKNFRASYYFIGLFLSLYKNVEIYLPGGCDIGIRPIDQHIKGFTALNVNLCVDNNILKANAVTMIGKEISLDVASVGATINIILASIKASGVTIIKNAAKEPEIVDFVNFLNSIGANITGHGSSVIIIHPCGEFKTTTYKIMPDRIVAGTYLLYGAMLANKLTLTDIKTKDMYCLINTLINMGASMDIKDNQITIYKIKNLEKMNIKTGVFPSFPSDLQQIMSICLFNANGVSLVEETLFENRFAFLKEITKMSGKFFVFENKAIIIPSNLKPSEVIVKDLRGGAALLLACMLANGTSKLFGVEYIERGYQDIVNVLKSVGVIINEITC